jgi:hypothetical protein
MDLFLNTKGISAHLKSLGKYLIVQRNRGEKHLDVRFFPGPPPFLL